MKHLISLLAGALLPAALFGQSFPIEPGGGGGGGSGTVTSIGATSSSAALSITGSPIAVSGTFAFSLDADLTAMAALTGTNTIYYRSADGVWSPVTFSGLTFSGGLLTATGGGGGGDLLAANNLSELTNTTTARANLGLVINTNVLAPNGSAANLTGITDAQLPSTIARDSEVAAAYQPLDADLTSIAGASGTNTLYYRSAADTWSAVTIGANLTFTGGTLSATGGGGGGGDLLAVNNLSELTNKATARTNLELNTPTGWLTTDKLLTVGAPVANLSDVRIDAGAALAVRMQPTSSASNVTFNILPKGTGVIQFAEPGLNYAFLVGSTGMQFTYAGVSYVATAAGLTLLDDADAAAQRATLGVAITATGFNGNLATTDDTIQEVAQKFDDIVIGGGGGDATLAGTQTFTGAKTFDLPITVNKNFISPDQAMGASAIDTSELNNTVSSAVPTTLTFSAEPAAGATFGVWITNTDAVEHIWTIPSTISEGLGVARTALLIQPGEPYYVRFRHKGSGVYWMDGDPIDYTDYPSDIPVSDDLLVYQQDSSGLYRTTTVADLIGSVGAGDSLLVNGTAITNIAGLDLIDSADIVLTLNSGASPNTVSFALPATVDLDAKTAVLVPTVATATNTTAAASSAMVQARITAWVTESASLQNKSLTHSSNTLPNRIQIACSDMTTAITTGQNKAYFRAPHAMTVGGVRASSFTAPTGAAIIIDVEEEGSSILGGTRLQVDATENTSQTAVNPATISDPTIADDALVTIDFDQVGSTLGGAGIIVTIYYEY